MDYLVTMDTGEQFIAHHGVQGMKWGVWNTETRARYSGGTVKSTARREVYKASNHGQSFGDSLRKRYNKGAENNPDYDDVSWNKITEAIKKEANRNYNDKNDIDGEYSNFIDAAYTSVQHGKLRKSAGEYYLDRKLGDEKRSLKLNRYDNLVYKLGSKQDKSERDLRRYSKAKEKFEKEYEKLNPERSSLFSMDEPKAKTEAKVKDALDTENKNNLYKHYGSSVEEFDKIHGYDQVRKIRYSDKQAGIKETIGIPIENAKSMKPEDKKRTVSYKSGIDEAYGILSNLKMDNLDDRIQSMKMWEEAHSKYYFSGPKPRYNGLTKTEARKQEGVKHTIEAWQLSQDEEDFDWYIKKVNESYRKAGFR